MANWYQCLPGFFLPTNVDCGQFPPYSFPDPDLPDVMDIIKIPGIGETPKFWWAAWEAARRLDRIPKLKQEALTTIAWRKYDSARYVALVPEWRRTMTEWVTYLDDIEDQLSTILWLAEMLGKKVVPIPPGVLNLGDSVRKYLDAAEKALALTPGGRAGKVEWRKRQQETARQKREARGKIALMLVWIKANYARLLEAAQATNTWFDVGIVLGPVMGYLDEGIWGLAQRTLDNYLIAADALAPGYRDDFYRNAEEQSEALQLGLTDAIEYAMTSQLFGYSLEDLFYTR